MATHSSILTWKTPWSEEPGWLQSMGSKRSRTAFFCLHAAAAAKSLQSCLTLCDPIDGSPLGSPVLHHLPKQYEKVKETSVHAYLCFWLLNPVNALSV